MYKSKCKKRRFGHRVPKATSRQQLGVETAGGRRIKRDFYWEGSAATLKAIHAQEGRDIAEEEADPIVADLRANKLNRRRDRAFAAIQVERKIMRAPPGAGLRRG